MVAWRHSTHLLVEAGQAATATVGGLGHHPVARLQAPAVRVPLADFFDHSNRLVAGNHWVFHQRATGVRLNVRATNPAGLDSQQGVVIAQLRPRRTPAPPIAPARPEPSLGSRLSWR